MKLSVVNPCFNNEASTAHSILAGVNQAHRRKGIIVVDDLSFGGKKPRPLKIVEYIRQKMPKVENPRSDYCINNFIFVPKDKAKTLGLRRKRFI